jgi:hypothetical protein
VLIGSLWRIRGAKVKQKILDWFYRDQARVAQSKTDWDSHARLLAAVHAAGSKDTQELMIALLADPRFDQTDWRAMKELLEIASDGLPEPLVSPRELHSVWPPRDNRTTKAALAEWREILKRHYKP